MFRLMLVNKGKAPLRLVAVAAIVASTLLLEACDRGPSITQRKCDALLAAVDQGSSEEIGAAIDAILDIGTEEQPEAVEPKIFADALLVNDYLQQGDQPGFNMALDQLVADCRSIGQPSTSRVSRSAPQERTTLASTIRERLERIIADRNLPYAVVSAEFEDVGSEAREVNLPEGTILWVVFDDRSPSLGEVTLRTAIYDPLEAYCEALRPEFESGQLDFVVTYFLAWRNATQGVFQITPFLMRLYLDGQITIKELSEKMVITVRKN